MHFHKDRRDAHNPLLLFSGQTMHLYKRKHTYTCMLTRMIVLVCTARTLRWCDDNLAVTEKVSTDQQHGFSDAMICRGYLFACKFTECLSVFGLVIRQNKTPEHTILDYFINKTLKIWIDHKMWSITVIWIWTLGKSFKEKFLHSSPWVLFSHFCPLVMITRYFTTSMIKIREAQTLSR